MLAGSGVILHADWFPPSDALLAGHEMDRGRYLGAYADDRAYLAVLEDQYGPLVES